MLAGLVGYVGAGCIILGYFLSQKGVLRADGWRFPAINLGGSMLVLGSLLNEPNMPSIVIEVFWASISLYGLWRHVRQRKTTS